MRVRLLLTLIFVLTLHSFTKGELTQATTVSSFNYPYSTVLNKTNINSANSSIKVGFPWPIFMHGQLYFQTSVYSNSSLIFGSTKFLIQTLRCWSATRSTIRFRIYLSYRPKTTSLFSILVWTLIMGFRTVGRSLFSGMVTKSLCYRSTTMDQIPISFVSIRVVTRPYQPQHLRYTLNVRSLAVAPANQNVLTRHIANKIMATALGME